MVMRSMAIKPKGPESFLREIGVRARQVHVIMDHFLFLLHPQFIYMKTRISVAASFRALEKIQ